MRSPIFVALFLFACLSGQAQKQFNNWLFGEGAGISWNSGATMAFNGSAMSTLEGVGSISDSAGNLLFYTDGISVWNRQHQVMQNGSGLMGHYSSTQSGVIVPWPGSNTKYYVFTHDFQAGVKGFRYSVVDMSLNGGLGGVEPGTKNTLLYTPSCEKIATTMHANGTDVWVVTHSWNSNSFKIYRITPAGIDTVPLTVNAGTINGGSSIGAVGCLKFSPDGRKLVTAITNEGFVEFFEFDNSIGAITTLLHDDYGIFDGAYGVEFSPSNRYVYISSASPNEVFQYDLLAGSAIAIQASKIRIASGNYIIGALQLAPDNKIYCSKYDQNVLDVINNPNAGGLASGYQSSALSLSGNAKCKYGLPAPISSFFDGPVINFDTACFGQPTSFSTNVATPDSVFWNFGDMAAGSSNTSQLIKPAHIFSSAGSYLVKLFYWNNGVVDSLKREVVVREKPVISLGADTNLCAGQVLTLDVSMPYGFYKWQNNSRNGLLNISQTGDYWVEVTVANCSSSDTIHVSVAPPIIFNLGNDTTFCSPKTLLLKVTVPGATYLWQNGSTSSQYLVTQSGNYMVTVTKGYCSVIDSVSVTVFSKPPVNLVSSATIFCPGNASQVCAPGGYANYVWNSSSLNYDCILVDSAGEYSVTVTDIFGCTAASNPIILNMYSPPAVSVTVSGDTLFAFGGVSYRWYLNGNFIPGSSNYFYVIQNNTGSYSVEVTDSNGCKAMSNVVVISTIERLTLNEVLVSPNPFSNNITIYNAPVGCIIQLTDVAGRKLAEVKVFDRNVEINTEVLQKGIYFLQLTYNGNQLVKHLVKQ